VGRKPHLARAADWRFTASRREVTSRIVFGKEASELTVAEQMVLASAVNKPIILMPAARS